MFSNFFSSKKMSESIDEVAKTDDSSTASSPPQTIGNIVVDTSAISVDESLYQFEVNTCGAKGWPSKVSCINYSRHWGLITVGTSDGSVYSFGDGIQYLQPNVANEGDDNGIKFVTECTSSFIVIVLNDNSICTFAMPNLGIVHFERGTWLDERAGNISCLYADESSDRPFIYIGTEYGVFHVLDVSGAGFRICDYTLTRSEFGVSDQMSVSAIQLSHKDERYVAVGFQSIEAESGTVIIYDLVKHKNHRSFNTNCAITSLAWSIPGDSIYAGCLNGDVLCLSEKTGTFYSFFNSSSEVSDDVDDLDDAQTANKVPILQVKLLPLPSGDSCIFVLLGSRYIKSDTLYLKNSIIGLKPSSTGDATTVFSLPPICGEDIVALDLIPTQSAMDPRSTPALLLLTKTSISSHVESITSLKIMRCPTSGINEWPLEIGMLPEPVSVPEVSLGLAPVSIIAGYTPISVSKPLSIASVLVKCLDGVNRERSNQGRCLSQRSFFSHFPQLSAAHAVDREASESSESIDHWNTTLASGNTEIIDVVQKRPQNLVLMGHSDGNIIVWACCRSSSSSGASRASAMIPVGVLRLSSDEISAIGTDDSSGLLVVGDVSGNVGIFEAFDSINEMGYIAYQEKIIMNQVSLSSTETTSNSKATEDVELSADGESVDDNPDENSSSVGEEGQSETVDTPYAPNCVRKYTGCQLDSKISSILLLGDICTVIIGTEDGDLFRWSLTTGTAVDKNASPGQKSLIIEPSRINLSMVGTPASLENVLALHYSSYLKGDEIVPAVYAIFASGQIIIVHPVSGEILAFTTGPSFNSIADGTRSVNFDNNDESQRDSYKVSRAEAVVCILDSQNRPAATVSTTELLTLAKYEIDVTNSNQASPTKGIFSMLSSSPTRSVPRVAPASKVRVDAGQSLPEGCPASILVASGRSIYSYDNSKFIPLISGKLSARQSSATTSSALLSSQYLTKSKVIAGQVLSYYEEATRAWSGVTPCLTCITADGGLLSLRIPDKMLICSEQLLDHVVHAPAQLTHGMILHNGECFTIHGGRILYSSEFSLVGHILMQPKSSKVEPIFNAVAQTNIFSLQQNVGKAPKRSSILGIGASTDLSKVFSKTMDQRQKEELFGGLKGSKNDSGSISKSTSRQVEGAAAVARTMLEAREALEERGERINRVALRADEIANNAQEYNTTTKELASKLKKKSTGWSSFF